MSLPAQYLQRKTKQTHFKNQEQKHLKEKGSN
uniref:Uncharacterized protein n=1 Tax=Rhizophora mucronata TaxID=61149 RepID=A0A2P2PL61_RHIMU